MPAPSVLVVGAGPTGLALALQLHALGADIRIVERRPQPFRPSRAMIVHPRTLEVLRPLGVVDELLARARPSPQARLHLGSRVVPVGLGDFDLPDTAYPYLTLARQMDVETVLAEALAQRGVHVERGTQLIGLSTSDGAPQARLRSAAGVEDVPCGFVVGCDGANSTVRSLSGIAWRGARYHQEVVLADVELDGMQSGAAHVVATRGGLLFVFAIGERATWRLLVTRPVGGLSLPSEETRPRGGELQRMLDDAGVAARITKLAWSGSVRLQHRLAARYRHGRTFLAGDAAHVHSPAAAQGMNTGIQDAINLGWKLAFAASSTDPDLLLDSYQHERRPVARQVIALTHLVFWAEAGTDPCAAFVRRRLAPLGAPLIPLVMDRRRMVAAGVRVMSQLRVGYRGSPLSVDAPPRLRGGPRAGERLPDATVVCDGIASRLHGLLIKPAVHLLLQRDADDPGMAARMPYVHVHRLAGTPGAGVLAVRPDGYVGFRCGAVDQRLHKWLATAGATT
jgi:2-polyprenyl-6-methoxyphenol hydroxylase-like FAD-dependent oxidoreductase